VRRFVAKFVDERDGVLSIRRGWVLGFESVEWHECYPSSFFFDHDIENFGGSSVVVDDNVEETSRILVRNSTK
jgi:hypothetical protein